jgi:hypothetical protein
MNLNERSTFGSAAILAGMAQHRPGLPASHTPAQPGPGGGADFVALRRAGHFGPARLQVIVDNRPAGLPGQSCQAPPDGYTLLLNGNSF